MINVVMLLAQKPQKYNIIKEANPGYCDTAIHYVIDI